MLILPAAIFVAALVFSIVLTMDALALDSGKYERAQHRYVREQLLSDMMGSLAKMLGLVPSLIVAALVSAAAGLWLYRTVRRYRELKAKDAQVWGR
ncbi:MAG: hypothetical protein HOW73_48860 [Polyangiaceae bacterium]|nr:hypothetical protein [Polyangiaceae bacterium]